MMTRSSSKRTILAGSSLLVMAIAAAQPALAQDTTISSSITTGSTWNGTTAPGSNFTVTSSGAINTADPAAITVAGTVGALLGTLLNSGQILDAAASGYGISIGSVSVGVVNNSGLISGASAIYNTGTLGAVSNTGTVSGTARGIYLSSTGSIGSLNNSGLIAAGTLGSMAAGGIANSGRIGTIVNNGTIISAHSSGIGNNQSTGSIGQLVNNGLISGVTGGIWNQGTFSQITNTGQIVGTQAGIFQVAGVLSALDNSGTISGGSYGVSIGGGNVGTLVNSGLLSGPIALTIASGATLGGVANSGVIAGNIVNRSVNVLTITGGTGTQIGTLTGSTLTNQGSIINTVSNLVFGSGNLLLNDNINVTGRTVSNVGAALSLNSIVNVAGAFSQTAGSLQIDPMTGGLIVSGGATFSGGTVKSTFQSTGNYLAGSYTLLNASSLNLTGATVSINSLTGLYKSTSTVGNKLLLSVNNDYIGGALASLTNAAALTSASTGLYVATTGSIGTLTNTGTLGGGQFGINNRGTIGTLLNAGRVTDNSFTALWNQGSIGQLINTGTIINSSWAILNTGNLATLTNSGLISGAGNAIQNSGVITLVNNSGTMSGGSNAIAGNFGTIVNSGVILGDINKYGGSIGAIIGGANGTIGTLTGFTVGTQGTIGASSNLTFASGALLLNDSITAVGIAASALTVSNTGADITLATIVNVNGNFRQTAGTLTLGGTGKLVVTQAASLTGGAITTSTGGLSSSSTYLKGAVGGTLVAGGAGSSYSGVNVSITSGFTGLTGASTTSGNNLLLAIANDYVGDTQVSISNSGSISGVSYALYVAGTGSIGTFTNSGVLTGLSTGATNNGSIGSLSNSGLISGAMKGLGNQATIANLTNTSTGTILGGTAAGLQNDTWLGTLTNAGYISSGSAGFANYGTLGLLTNSGSISGGPQALYLVGTVGTVSNSGTITSGQTGIYVGATMSALVNSGFIGNTSNALNLGGTLDTLINAAGGTISGGNALYMSGSLGGFANSGVVKGKIDNQSVNNLTITGGAGATVGTLTGLTGVGTINNTLSNLIFASGNLLLNDRIVATGHTVSNTGANLSLTSNISITGAYSQSAGTLNLIPGASSLIVIGAANITGGTVAASLSATGNYLAGVQTLVSASSLNLTGATVSINSLTGLYKSTSTVGNKLLLSVNNDYIGGALASLTNAASLTSASTGLYVATTGSIGTLTNTGTLGGGQFGINNRGTIGTLLNAGRVTDNSFTALWNQGSIGQLINTGTIINSSWAILNTGNLATLTNSGLISGAGNAIQNNGVITLVNNSGTMSGGSNAVAGNFGTIVNSGVILGDINKYGGSIGAIIGGANGTIGTLTGFTVGTQGTIGASSNLTFASGALLLNDSITAAGIAASALTVSNTGADITLATIVNVNGNFRQTAGMLNLGGTGKLVVTQAASLTGGTVSTSLSSTGNYLAGNTAGTLVQGGAGSSYAGVAVTGGTPGLALSAGASGNNLVVTADNNYVGASLASLSNTGSLTADYSVYVASTGSLGSLTNSGTLSGSIAALYNAGTLGAIANTGVIAGNIENVAAQDLIFTGGAGASVGTLTGLAGAPGTITNTAGDVVFASGNLVLNDQIVATGHTVSNTGANLSLVSNISITGDYSQSAGTLNLIPGASSLIVSGVASITGGTVATSLPLNANYLAGGGAGTLVQGGAGSSYAGVTLSIAATPGLALTASVSGNDLVMTVANNYVGSTLATLSNTGSLTADYPVYLAATSNLGSLSNSGTLSGAVAALYNAGTLGVISNTGVIAGNIVNVAAQGLTFTGAAASGVGTLTGFGGGRGTITNTGGDVVFAAGNLLLNDDIVVTGHGVSNTGAALTLANSANITGDYSQTAGSLNLASGQKLIVSGAASLTGGTVSTSLSSTGNYLAGSTAGTLVQGGAGSSYAGVAVTTGTTPGLALSAGTSGNNLVVTAGNNYVGASLASLSNTGSLTADYPVYVASTGSLASLTNSGTLSGSIAALYNAGTLGVIANTGVIAGNIENVAAQDLIFTGGAGPSIGAPTTFAGKSGSVAMTSMIAGDIETSPMRALAAPSAAASGVGTLTGFGGGRGTITNTGGDVVFAAGNLLLNDDIVVTGHGVSNTGAALTLANSANITGDYSQTAGSLNLASGQKLIVSGAASLTGGTVSTSLSATANYLAGSTAGTLVQGGVGSSYAGVVVTTGTTPGLALSGGTSGANLVVTAGNNYVGASLAGLSNTGSLTADYPVYVASTGSLASLNNSGTLSGAVAALYNAGTLGTIANTGVIAGNIENLSSTDLRIAGGSGASFGTLTGYAASSQGAINNLSSNVVLTGNILLNDTLNLGDHTLIANDATLQLNSITRVNGNYSQSGGMLLIGVTSTTAYGQLQVSGTASLTGATVKLVALGTGTISAGGAYTVVKATGGLTYSNLTSSVSGLEGAFSSVASEGATGLVLTIDRAVQPTRFAAAGAAAGGAGVGTGMALDAIADAGGALAAPVITDVLMPLAILSSADQQRGVIQLSPSQLAPQVVAVAMSPALNAITRHQDALMANAGGPASCALTSDVPSQNGVVWGQFLFNSSKRDVAAGATSYDATNYGVVVGADVVNTANLVVGGALNWTKTAADGRAELAGSTTRISSVQASGYFTWRPGDARSPGLSMSGQFGVGYNAYRQHRQIDFLGRTASASFDGRQYLGQLRAGYTIPLADAISVTPFASVRAVHLKNDGYTESGAGAANLQVGRLTVDSVSHEIGIQGGATLDTAAGRISPSLKIGWVHNYDNGPIPLNAALGGVAFSSSSARVARDGATVNAGVSFVQNERLRVGVQYDGELRRAFQSHSATVELRYRF
uniref:Outer membrane autotransporter barrel domain protein n=1 Tax=Caulobacter sp. (strain K31) TaxID=366602 RepID=B0T4N4_CAUSK